MRGRIGGERCAPAGISGEPAPIELKPGLLMAYVLPKSRWKTRRPERPLIVIEVACAGDELAVLLLSEDVEVLGTRAPTPMLAINALASTKNSLCGL